MKVVLLRHAARSPQTLSLGLEDSPLNSTGLAQAANLASGFLMPQGPLPTPTEIWTSPKRRAFQTLEPLADVSGLTIKKESRLDERCSGETTAAFVQRIEDVISELEDRADEGTLYLCTHLDWLEEVMPRLPSDMSDAESSASWSPGEFRVFKIEGGLWKLKLHGRP